MAYSKRPAPGQATSANSDPVVIASDQSSIPVTFTGSSDAATQTTLALIKAKTDNLDIAISGIKTGTDKIIAAPATAAKQAALGTAGEASTDVITVQGIASMTALKVDNSAVTQPVSFTGSTDVATQMTLATRLSESDFDSKTGALTETAPGTDTASSGLNGRLQRIAQRISSLIALLPATLGQGTMSTSLKVVLPSDQSTLPVSLASVPSHAVTNAGTFVVQALLSAGSAIAGKFGLDQTTPGTTNAVSVAQLGATTVATGNGVSSAGTMRVALVSDGTGNISTIGTSIIPGTGATHLGKAEDAVHASGDTGVMALAVRSDTPVVLVGASGDYTPLTTGPNGGLWASLATLIRGEDETLDIMKAMPKTANAYISTATTTVIKSGAGILHTLIVSGGTAGTIILYDNTAASGTILASFDSTNALLTYTFNCAFSTGLTIVTSAATKLSVNYI